MTNVVEIGEFRITQRRRHEEPKGCSHLHFTVGEVGETVICDDCGLQISAHWALLRLVDCYLKEMNRLRHAAAMQQEVESKTIHLKAAQKVERAWRSQSMVPTCPHCHEGIFPQDGFGGSMTNREMALRRRKNKVPAFALESA